MPIKLQIHHPDRMVVGVLDGAVTVGDLVAFAGEIVAAQALRYRKIVDVIGAGSGLTADDLAAFSEHLHQASLPRERGPLALVADRQTAPLAELFARLMGDDRSVKVFASIHAARQWLHANSVIT
jgi:riboflavin biosynthesis pyrimidine reductase